MRTFLWGMWMCLSFSSLLHAQVLNWTFDNIVTDVQESGAAPQLLADAQGNLHATYWQQITDQLYYGFRDVQTGKWTFTLVPDQGKYGYRSSIELDGQGNVQLAYLFDNQGESSIRYAQFDGTSWTIENVEKDSILTDQFIGIYGFDSEFPTYVQPSLDLFFMPDGRPSVLYFDGNYNIIEECPDNNIFLIYKIYAMDMRYRVKNVQDDWFEVRAFNVPLTGNCLSDGERFGEFCKMHKQADGSYYALTLGMHDDKLLLFRNQDSSLTSWDMFAIDSLTRIAPFSTNITTRMFYESFGFIDSKLLNDSILHITYNVSNHFGQSNTNVTGRNTYYYLRVNLNQLGNPGAIFHSQPDPAFSLQTFQNSITPVNDSTVMLAYYERFSGRIIEQYTTDGAQSWTERVLGEFTTQSPIQSTLLGDTLFLIAHHNENDQLWFAKRHVNDTVWQTQFLTTSFKSGDVLASLVNRKVGDDEVHIVYNEVINKQLFYGIRQGGTWMLEEIPFVAEGTASVSLILDDNGQPVIGFIPESNDEIKIFRKNGGNWSQESVVSGQTVDDVALAREGNNELVFFFDADERGLALATKPVSGSNWGISLVDTTSAVVGDQPRPKVAADGTLHVAYVDISRSLIKYGVRTPGGNWELSEVTPDFEFNPTTIDLALDTLDQPLIAFRDAFVDSIFLAEWNGTAWESDQVEGESADFTGVDLNLVISDLNSPWIAYNFLTSVGELRLVFRDPSGVWKPISVLANSSQIAEPFDFHLIEKDFYVIGQKAQINNRGLGLLYASEGLSTLTESEILQPDWQLFPNPASQYATLSWKYLPQGPLNLSVYNVNGQAVYFYSEKIAKDQGQIILNTEDWVPGVYMLSIQYNNQVETLKMWVMP